MKLRIFRNCPAAAKRLTALIRHEARILKRIVPLLHRAVLNTVRYRASFCTVRYVGKRAVCSLQNGRLVLRALAVLLTFAVVLPVSAQVSTPASLGVTFIAPKQQTRAEAAITAHLLPIEIQHPVSGTITTRYSIFHPGIDIAATYGTPMRPIGDGRVAQIQHGFLGLGNTVIIDHGEGLVSEYGHLSKIQVKTGDAVTKDTIIGRIGSTGFSTGPHLHLEIHDQGKPIDPLKLLPKA